MKNKAKKIWLWAIDAATIMALLFFHIAIIIVLGVAIAPFIVWRWIKGDEEDE